MKVRINCPNHQYPKILIAYDPHQKRFWVHCGDRKCNRWVQVDINKNGGITAKLLPITQHFNFDSVAVVSEGVRSVRLMDENKSVEYIMEDMT